MKTINLEEAFNLEEANDISNEDLEDKEFQVEEEEQEEWYKEEMEEERESLEDMKDSDPHSQPFNSQEEVDMVPCSLNMPLDKEKKTKT